MILPIAKVLTLLEGRKYPLYAIGEADRPFSPEERRVRKGVCKSLVGGKSQRGRGTQLLRKQREFNHLTAQIANQ